MPILKERKHKVKEKFYFQNTMGKSSAVFAAMHVYISTYRLIYSTECDIGYSRVCSMRDQCE